MMIHSTLRRISQIKPSYRFKIWIALTGYTATYWLILTRQLSPFNHSGAETYIGYVLLILLSILSWFIFLLKSHTLRLFQGYASLLTALAALQYAVVMAQPAYAGIFTTAEDFIKQCFPIADTLVSVVFNSLRFLLLIYVAWSLVNSIRGARDGEDWLTLARTPALIVLMFVISDGIFTLLLSGVTC